MRCMIRPNHGGTYYQDVPYNVQVASTTGPAVDTVNARWRGPGKPGLSGVWLLLISL